MKVKVIQNTHENWELEQFPTFAKGTKVTHSEIADEHFAHWFEAQIEGRETFVPASFVCDGALNRDYNPTELVQKIGDVLEVNEIVNAWLIATNENGKVGWIPAENVVSI